MSLTLKQKVSLCYNSALEKKAKELVLLDVRRISDVTDVFMIGGGTSGRQAQAIIDSIEDALRSAGEKTYHIEGYDNAQWILLDAGDVVVNIFQDQARRYYDLERLWADAVRWTPGDGFTDDAAEKARDTGDGSTKD